MQCGQCTICKRYTYKYGHEEIDNDEKYEWQFPLLYQPATPKHGDKFQKPKKVICHNLCAQLKFMCAHISNILMRSIYSALAGQHPYDGNVSSLNTNASFIDSTAAILNCGNQL